MLEHVIRQMAFQKGPEISNNIPGLCPYLGCDLILLAVLEKSRVSSPTFARFRSAVDHIWKQQVLTMLSVQFAGLSCNCCSLQSGLVCRHILPVLRKHADISCSTRSRCYLIFDEDAAQSLLRDYLPTSSLFLSYDIAAQSTETASLLYQSLLGSKEPIRAGAFSTVYRAHIPPAHRTMLRFNGDEYVALKLIDKQAKNFSIWLNEKEILQQLEQFNHPSIVRLLDAYCIDDNFLLLFPLAQCDLGDVMSSELKPAQTSSEMISWMLTQMQGLSQALEYLHVGSEQYKAFGRHGDLKPENILLYSDVGTGTGMSTPGNLVIADLGLSQFHRRTAESSAHPSSCLCDAVTAHRNLADRQYAAPEVEIPSLIGSASDIWSLGCVLLEYVVWVVYGAESRVRFLESLRSGVPGHPASYWHIDPLSPQKCRFLVKPQVSAYLQHLNENASTKGSRSLQALVNHLIYSGLLDPDPSNRPTARDFGDILRLVEKGIKSNLTTPVWSRSWMIVIDALDQCSPMGTFGTNDTSKTLKVNIPPRLEIREGAWTSCDFPKSTEDWPCTRGSVHVPTPQSLGGLGASESFWRCDDPTECSWDDGLPFKQKCPFCPEVARPAALKPHIKSKHRYKRLFECKDCGGLFADRHQLALHHEGVDLQIRDGVRLRIYCTFSKDILATSVRELVQGTVLPEGRRERPGISKAVPRQSMRARRLAVWSRRLTRDFMT